MKRQPRINGSGTILRSRPPPVYIMKFPARFLLPVVGCSLLLWAAQAITFSQTVPINPSAPAIPTKVVFTRDIRSDGTAADHVKETYPWGEQILPSHRIAVAGQGFLHHTFATPRPAGTHTQVLKFRFRSNDLFTTNPEAHFFVSGRSESTSWYNRGRGFIVGDLSGTLRPCQGHMVSQPESWWTIQAEARPSSIVWNGEHCGPSMQDHAWYDVELHINSADYFAYWLRRDGQLVTSQLVHDTENPEGNILNNKLTGFAFGLVFARNYTQSWSLEFDNISVSWL